MDNYTPVHDLIDEQDELKTHEIIFRLWPRQWSKHANDTTLDWSGLKLAEAERQRVPEDSGIYTLVVQPDLFGHPACSFLMYVGKTKSLKRRFGEYLREKQNPNGRKKIIRILNKYKDNTWFYFSIIPQRDISDAEDMLLDAYIPPCNDKFPASIRNAVMAF